jgi:hypothetical protein
VVGGREGRGEEEEGLNEARVALGSRTAFSRQVELSLQYMAVYSSFDRLVWIQVYRTCCLFASSHTWSL